MKNILYQLILLLLITSNGFAQSIQLYVDADKEGENKKETFGTLQQALEEAIRRKAVQGHWVDTTYIWLRGGDYALTEPVTLDYRSSGLAGAPLVISAGRGEKVTLRGGREVPAHVFQPVTDKSILERMLPMARAKVWVADLKKAGIAQFDRIHSQGLNIEVKPAAMELVYNDTVMQIARWPNAGYDTYGKVTDEGSIPRFRGMTLAPGAIPIDPLNPPERFARYLNDTTNRPGSLLYIGDRPLRWTKAADLWLFGWWREPWASQTLKVKTLDTTQKQISFEQPHHYGLADSGLYYAFNLLEEIDRPGEYYIDRQEGLLYFWPTRPIHLSKAVVTMADQPLFHLNHASHVILQDLTMEAARGNAIEITGGHHNSVVHCLLRNIGLNGIEIKDGRAPAQHHRVSDCEFYFIRGFALDLGGGSRSELIPASNTASNNHFHHEARVSIKGVGNHFRHNLSHDIDNNALVWRGNDHLIEYNEFFNCMSDADDMGVMYTGRNPSGQGTVVRFNYLHHNGSRATLHTGANGIYLDDGTTGQIIYGNVFYKTGKAARARMGALFLHGAKDNLIVNNVFIDCDIAIGFSPWPQERWEQFLVAGDMKKWLYEDVNIKDSLYQARYPNLQRLQAYASVNQVYNNLSVLCAEFLSFPAGRFVEQKTSNNWETRDQSFFGDYQQADFTLKKTRELLEHIPGFHIIPFERIGLEK
jgi:hypothetical protein